MIANVPFENDILLYSYTLSRVFNQAYSISLAAVIALVLDGNAVLGFIVLVADYNMYVFVKHITVQDLLILVMFDFAFLVAALGVFYF